MKTTNNYENKKIDKLPFEILSMIFFAAQNPNLATVSKKFYVTAHDTITMLNCISKWKKQIDQECCYLCTFKRMIKDKDLMVAIFKKDLSFGCTFKEKKLHLYSIILNKGYLEVLFELLTQTILEEIPSDSSSNPTNPKKIYQAKPLINVNFCNFDDYVNSLSVNLDAFFMLEDAHRITINILDQHNVTKEMLLKEKTCVQIHKTLSDDLYAIGLIKSVASLDLIKTKIILDRCVINKEISKILIHSGIESDNYAMFSLIINHPKMKNTRKDINFYSLAVLQKKSNLYKCFVTPRIEQGNIKFMTELLGEAIVCNSIEMMELFILNGADLSSVKTKNISLAVENDCIDSLFYYIESRGLKRIPKETRKILIKSSSAKLKMGLLDLGLDPRFDKDYMLHYALNHLKYFNYRERIFDDPKMLIKRLLEAGCDVYERNSKILKDAISNRKTEILHIILEYSKKTHADLQYILYEFRFDKETEIARMMIKHYIDALPNLGAILYKHRATIGMSMANLYLEYGAGKTRPYGSNMVKYAINKGEIKMADLLMHHDTILDYNDIKVFREAISMGCASVVEKYLESDEFNKDDILIEFPNACRKNNNEIVTLFLKNTIGSLESKKRKKTASQNLKSSFLVNTKGGKFLEIAIENKNMEMINILLEYGAKPEPNNKKLFLDSIKQENLYAINSYLQVLNLNNQVHRDIVGEGLAMSVHYRCSNIYDILFSFMSNYKPTKKEKIQPKLIKVSEDVKSISQNLKNNILQQACNLGNMEYARKAIEMGADVNGIEPDTF
ncbi:hypothetical protein BB559_006915, partial [Furculomyces boomerangus]